MKNPLFAALAVLWGCNAKIDTPPVKPTGALVEVKKGLPADHPPINVTEVPAQGFIGRRPTRLSADQLKATLEAVTDGIIWRDTVNGVPDTDVIEYLAPTLGRPDYAQVTHENLDPNVLMAKFMADGARKVCVDVAARDRTRTASRRILTARVSAADTPQSNLEAVTRNIVELRTRFLGDASTGYPQVAPYVKVISDTLARGGTVDDGWLAVCVAMLTDPLFISY